jgi:hypothetical protein
VITRDPGRFHIVFHYNISEQHPLCTESCSILAASRWLTPAMNVVEYQPDIHIDHAITYLRWHGLDTTENYCLAPMITCFETVFSLLNITPTAPEKFPSVWGTTFPAAGVVKSAAAHFCSTEFSCSCQRVADRS